MVVKKTTFLYVGPQLFEMSLTRTLKRMGLVKLGTVCPVARSDSITSLKVPSVAVKAVPFPLPGSKVPQKYSPAIMRD